MPLLPLIFLGYLLLTGSFALFFSSSCVCLGVVIVLARYSPRN